MTHDGKTMLRGQGPSAAHALLRRAAILLAALATSVTSAAGFPGKSAASALRFARGWNPSNANPSAASVVERTASGRRFHEVAFCGGGFALVEGEGARVFAFSTSGELGEDDGSPLWTLVRRDLAIRPSASAGTTASALSDDSPTSIPDIRVQPMVMTRWNQGYAGGRPCYNCYTPSHHPCGCVATCVAQIMRYHGFPAAGYSVPQNTYVCSSNGFSVALTLMGGEYDWTAMPLVPTTSSSDAGLREIGKLCHDVGVSMHTGYASGGSSAVVPLSVSPLTEVFGYANAAAYFLDGTASIHPSILSGAIYPSLDAGCPVMLGIIDTSSGGAGTGHAVIADGYGYSDGALYTHLNMGWGGVSDVWYNLPSVDTPSNSFSVVNSVVYNIFPTNSGEVVSGRITDSANNPIAGVVVTATGNAGGTTIERRASSNSNGIYALILPADTYTGESMYSLTAEKGGMNTEHNTVYVSPSSGFSSIDNGRDGFEYAYQAAGMWCGNVGDMNFILTSSGNTQNRLYVSTDGDDGNTGSEDAPFATISAAVAAALDGDAVIVGPGVFAPFSSDGKRVTVTAAEGPSATIIDGRYASSCFEDLKGTKNTVISGFTLRRGYCILEGGGAYGGTLVNCVIEECHSDSCGGGAYMSSLDNCILSGNSAYSCGAADECELAYCTVMGNSALLDSGGLGGSCNASCSIVFGNTIEDEGECNYPPGSIYIGSFSNCCVRPMPPTGTSCFTDDPMVVDAHNGDWRLRHGSPCIVEGGHDIGAVEDACATGHVVSVWTYCGGTADSYTKVVEDGGSASFRFSGREVVHLFTNGMETAASESITLTGISGDIFVEAVFTNHTYHVAEYGSDLNDGLSAESPFATIQHAVDESADCDEILVHPGTYAGFSAAGKTLDIVSTDGPASTVIDEHFNGRAVFLDFLSHTHSCLEGFTVKRGYSAYGGGVFGGFVARCILSDNLAAIEGGGAFGVTVHSSLITRNIAGTIETTKASGGGVSRSTVLNCTVPTNYLIATSRAHGGGAYNSEVLNSIVYGNSALRGACDTPDECNCDTSNSFIGVDPGFSNAANGDFTLSPSSCAIDAGCESYAVGDLDLAGNPRIQRGTVDAGCYEFNCPIWITPAAKAVNSGGQAGAFLVRAFGDWRIESDSDWLSLNASSGSGTQSVGYTVSANRTGAPRGASVTATDSGLNQAVADVEQIAAVQYPNWHGGHVRYGLFVGVSEYDTSFVRKSNWLSGCVYDATGLFTAFTSPRGYWPEKNCTILTNAAATCAAIRRAITNLAETAQSGDTVLYTHSSHGAASSNGSLDTWLFGYDGYYFDYDIASDLALFRDGVNVIVMVDACNSGGLFKDDSALMYLRGKASANIAWITAADYHQFSWDAETGFGGMFTSALLEGWSNGRADSDKNGYFDFLELFEYAAHEATGRYGIATTAQAYNEALLLRTIAGRADTGFKFILR